MAKDEPKTHLKVIFRRNWYSPKGLFKARAYPQEVPIELAEALPSTAKVTDKDYEPPKKDGPKALSELKQEDILPTRK